MPVIFINFTYLKRNNLIELQSILFEFLGLLTSLVMEPIGFVSSVLAGLLTLDLFAGTFSTRGHTPIFPDHVSRPAESNLGLAIATKNMTFMRKFCFCTDDVDPPHLQEGNKSEIFLSHRTTFHLCGQHCTLT